MTRIRFSEVSVQRQYNISKKLNVTMQYICNTLLYIYEMQLRLWNKESVWNMVDDQDIT